MKILIFGLLLFSITTQAQHDVIRLSDLRYHSDFEHQQFEAYFSQYQTNYLELFVASYQNGNTDLAEKLKIQLNSIFSQAYSDKLLKKNASRQIRTVYEKIHQELLTKYEAENYFTRIIENGSYNCVTATALYALVFEKLDIPYNLQEKPTHVYAIAYPDTDQVMVESTDPIGGFMSFNDRYKTEFVNRMTKAKLISTKEKGSKSLEQLFDEYYFQDKDIGIRELIGIQYMNQAIYELNANRLSKALSHLEKAYLFYPSENIGSVLMITTLQNLAQSTFNEPDDVQLLVNLTRMKPFGVTNDLILNEFNRALRALLIEQNKPEKGEKFYNELITLINEDSLNSRISHLYHFEKGRILYNKGDFKSSLEHLSKAFELNSINLNTENLFIGALSQRLRYESDFNLIRSELEKYGFKHKALSENIAFTSMLANTYLALFGQNYDLRNVQNGERYRKLFKGIYSDHLNIDQNYVGRAYSMAAVYFFRRGNNTKALEMLNEGLKIAPGNYELQSRKRMIE